MDFWLSALGNIKVWFFQRLQSLVSRALLHFLEIQRVKRGATFPLVLHGKK